MTTHQVFPQKILKLFLFHWGLISTLSHVRVALVAEQFRRGSDGIVIRRIVLRRSMLYACHWRSQGGDDFFARDLNPSLPAHFPRKTLTSFHAAWQHHDFLDYNENRFPWKLHKVTTQCSENCLRKNYLFRHYCASKLQAPTTFIFIIYLSPLSFPPVASGGVREAGCLFGHCAACTNTPVRLRPVAWELLLLRLIAILNYVTVLSGLFDFAFSGTKAICNYRRVQTKLRRLLY